MPPKAQIILSLFAGVLVSAGSPVSSGDQYSPKAWDLRCGNAKLTIVYGIMSDGTKDIAVIRTTKTNDNVQTDFLSDEVRPFAESHDLSKLKLVCVSGAPTIVVPEKGVGGNVRQLILTRSGRIIENDNFPLVED